MDDDVDCDSDDDDDVDVDVNTDFVVGADADSTLLLTLTLALTLTVTLKLHRLVWRERMAWVILGEHVGHSWGILIKALKWQSFRPVLTHYARSPRPKAKPVNPEQGYPGSPR